jgi:hypothetical protein
MIYISRGSMLLLAAGAMAAGTIAAYAQQPVITNADLRPASAAGGLEPAIRAAASAASGGPAWIGYAAPAIPGDYNNGCCWNDSGRGCGLEGARIMVGANSAPATPVRLEGPSHVVVLMRYEMGVPEKLRVFSPDCPLDAGGLPFYWLSAVKSAESVAMLADWHQKRQESRTRGGTEAAIHAIALHAGPEAEAALMKIANAATGEQARKSALFWLARSRGKVGYDVVAKVATTDESEKVREHAIYAMTQSKQPEAIPAVIRIAREDKSPRVRKQAMFWLGQSRDPRALDFFEQVLAK